METEAEKVYVAIGADFVDGFDALKWALKKWSSQFISIVILHAANNISKDFIITPFGKLPASSVSDEKLKALEKSEQAETNKILSKLVAFCGKVQVKAEIQKMERDDKPHHEVVVELVSSLRISKLVMALTFFRSSTWKSMTGIGQWFHIQQRKPEYCELFIISGGKQMFLKGEGEDEVFMEDDGVMVAKLKEKNSFRSWFGRVLPERSSSGKSPSSSSTSTNHSLNQWEISNTHLHAYFDQLLENQDFEVEDDPFRLPTETENKGAAENTEALKAKISTTQETIRLCREAAKANIERERKAEWAISLCTRRVEELEVCMQNEIAKRVDLQKELDSRKEELYLLQSEVEEKKTKLKSVLELQHEISSKLQSSSLARSHAQVQLEKAARTRSETVQEIEELRRQRDVLQRRIEFCKEKDAIGKAKMISEISFDYRKFTASEIRAATKNFSESLSLKSGGEWTNVYKGRINHVSVAILYNADAASSQETFQYQVKLLGEIRHPHLLSMIGFCSELNCIVFEYMHNGCLRDTLFSTSSSSRKKRRHISWHARIRIATEICKGLAFLHQVQPKPIILGSLNPSNILLDHHNVAKICRYKAPVGDELGITLDIHDLGNLILQLLTGRNWASLDEETLRIDAAAIIGFLDDRAGAWPQDLAIQLCSLAVRCLSNDFTMDTLMSYIVRVKEKADVLQQSGKYATAIIQEDELVEDFDDIPRAFLCPISKDVMKNPHVAADGFSYELEAIEEWLAVHHDTSPMINLKLKHNLLTPNRTLRTLIQDWHNRRSIPFR